MERCNKRANGLYGKIAMRLCDEHSRGHEHDLTSHDIFNAHLGCDEPKKSAYARFITRRVAELKHSYLQYAYDEEAAVNKANDEWTCLMRSVDYRR